MNLEQARQVRDKYKYLIGQKAKDLDANIYDVIVVPDDNLKEFIEEYRINMDDLDNDEMLLNYQSRSYSVNVIYDVDPEFVNIYSENISLYWN
ncbi:MAG TPA: hypothetical protein VNS32_27370 [Flavisolibacter sp.]|nr:hypothetical protein [Flavisolibacter sp.]